MHRRLARGLDGVATVAATAPWVGTIATLWGIIESFPACGCEKTAFMAVIFERLSVALVPSEVGLAVAIAAFVCRRYLADELAALDLDMDTAISRLPDYLERNLRLAQYPGQEPI